MPLIIPLVLAAVGAGGAFAWGKKPSESVEIGSSVDKCVKGRVEKGYDEEDAIKTCKLIYEKKNGIKDILIISAVLGGVILIGVPLMRAIIIKK